MPVWKMIAAALPGPEKVPVFFTIGKPLPTAQNPNTKIDRMILVGSAVDVFVRETIDGTEQVGSHLRLSPPSVQFLIESAERDDWQAESENAPGHDFTELTDPYGRLWKINGPTPQAPGSITRIVLDISGMGTVYALPNPGTPAAEKNLGFRFTFFPETGFVCMSQGMPITAWLDQIEFIESEAAAFDDDVEPAAPAATEPADGDSATTSTTTNGSAEIAPS